MNLNKAGGLYQCQIPGSGVIIMQDVVTTGGKW